MEKIDMLSEETVNLIRSKMPYERLQIAFSLSKLARARLEGYLRHRHPEWAEAEIHQELARRIARGSD